MLTWLVAAWIAVSLPTGLVLGRVLAVRTDDVVIDLR